MSDRLTKERGKRCLWVIERRQRHFYPLNLHSKRRSRWGNWSQWAPHIFHGAEGGDGRLSRVRAHELVAYYPPKMDEQFRVVRYTP